MPFPTPSTDLMASAMGGPLLTSSPAAAGSATTSITSSTSSKVKNTPGNGTVRIYYSLKENPNAIISYTDLIRQEQKRQRSSSKNGGNGTPNASSSATVSQASPLKNSKVTGAGTGSKDGGQSATSMDIDPPEGEEALGDGDSEAEDDDEADEDDDEDDAEAEDEDDDDDPEEDEDEDDDPESGQREPKDFLDALTEKYGLEEGSEGEDEDDDEDEDGKGQVRKRPSRWDTERYDFEDDFIDDSEMMLESIGMVRPKVDGFFAYRGPVETTAEDADSSDAGPRSKKTVKRKPAAGSSPLGTSKTSSSKSNKGSNLAVMENANDSTSEMSEAEERSKSTKPPPAAPGNSSLSTVIDATASSAVGDSTAGSVATTPTKKKTLLSKTKAAGKDVSKEGAEASKDSDKESKSGTSKKAKTKPTKTATSMPVVRVDSPPLDDITGNSPPPPPSRSASPSKSKSKSKAPATAETDPSDDALMGNEASESTSAQAKSETSPTKTESSNDLTVSPMESNSDHSKSKEPKPLEPLNEEVQAAYTAVADLAKKESWEVKSRFPPHIKEPLWECARVALATRSTGYVLDDSFFVHLQEILPYNKFTLKKLVYKAVLPDWIAELETQRARLIEQFATRADMVWKSSGLAAVDKPQTEKDGDGDVNMNGDEVKFPKKFPWSQDLRLLLWETMEKFMEIHAAKQELRAVDESQPVPPTDSKTRKDAYQTLLQSFPAGWMTSYEISRQYSQLKEKVQKQEKKEVESSATSQTGKPKPVFSGSGGTKYGTSTMAAARIASLTANAAAAEKRQVSAQSSSTSTATQLNPATSATPSVPPASTVPAASNVDVQRSSPSRSPSTTHRSAHLSEIVNPVAQPIQSRTQHLPFADGQESNKKRKNPEEGMNLGRARAGIRLKQ
ncbi:hypothetical protein BGX27_001587 [Mortierella sp. AM989]|nr:hypothetical protein BGX27_001587 [Mortierella sp. AM989]